MKPIVRHIIVLLMCNLMISCSAPPGLHAETQTIEVYKSDGSRQCEPDSGISLSQMQQELADAGIQVISSRNSRDCMMRPAVCGAGTGKINVYEIQKHKLSEAQERGFIPLSRLQARCGK